MPYIPYLPYIPNIPYFPNMPYQTDHTHHTYPPYHTTPPPHHRGGGGQCHTPTTPQGGEGEDLIWDQYMGPIHHTTGGGGGRSHMGPVYGTHPIWGGGGGGGGGRAYIPAPWILWAISYEKSGQIPPKILRLDGGFRWLSPRGWGVCMTFNFKPMCEPTTTPSAPVSWRLANATKRVEHWLYIYIYTYI